MKKIKNKHSQLKKKIIKKIYQDIDVAQKKTQYRLYCGLATDIQQKKEVTCEQN